MNRLSCCGLLLIILCTACAPKPFELTSNVTTGEREQLVFWWKCLSLKCSIVDGAPVNYTDLLGRPFQLVVEDAAEDGRALPSLTFVSSEESRLSILSSACNPSCVRDLGRTCDDATLECSGVYGYLLHLEFSGVGEVSIEARTPDGLLYDDVVFAVTPAQVD